MSDKVVKTDAEWRAILTPRQYAVTRKAATERPFTGEYLDNKAKGVYACVACGNVLFSSETKYDSGSGWPSFWDVIQEGNVATRIDTEHGMVRVETLCAQCDSHLGHVFEDGPQDKTGQRYCINSLALRFIPEE
jgi:peptide-methionine (R)-S-oxide reductase